MKKPLILALVSICLLVFFIPESFSEVPILPLNADLLVMRQDINTLNLLNGVHMTKPQMEKYLDILKMQKVVEDKMYNEVLNEYNVQQTAFKDYKNELIVNTGITEKTEKAAKETDENMKKTVIKYNEERYKLEKDLDKIFTENQRVIIDDYFPCLIPPEAFRDPTRIGQVGAGDDIIKGLTDIRKLNLFVYFIVREIGAKEYFKWYESHLKQLSWQEKEREKKRLFKIYDDARSMNDLDFEMKKEELAKRVSAKVYSDIGSLKKNCPHMLGNILLNVNMIPIIENRLASSK